MIPSFNNSQKSTPQSKKGSVSKGGALAADKNKSSTPKKFKGLLQDSAVKERAQKDDADSGIGQLFRQAQAKTDTSNSGTGNTAAKEQIKAKFGERFKKLADKPKAFHSMMKKVYGPGMNDTKAEELRQKAQKGDFSWLPKIKVIPAKDMNGGLGAYDGKSDTIYLSDSVMNDPNKAMQVYAEEVGHAMDKKFKTTDTKGDEGEMFRRLFMGEELSQSEMEKIRNEDDKGVINVNGREVEVEFFGFIKKIFKGAKKLVKGVGKGISRGIKSIGKGIKRVGKGIAKGVKRIGKGIAKGIKGLGRGIGKVAGGLWKGVKKVVSSGIFKAVCTVAQFIPPLAPIAKIGQVISAVVTAADGIKNGNLMKAAMGAVGAFSGLGKAGKFLGLSSKITNFANKAAQIGKWGIGAYNAVKNGRFEDLALSVAGKFAPNVDLSNVKKAVNVYQRARVIKGHLDRGDTLGALTSLTSWAGSKINDNSKLDKALDTFTKIGGDVNALHKAVKNKDWTKAVDLVMGDIKSYTNLDHNTLKSVYRAGRLTKSAINLEKRFQNKDYVGAALGLAEAGHIVSKDKNVRDTLVKLSHNVQQSKEVFDALENKQYDKAFSKLNKMLGNPVPIEKPLAQVDKVRQTAKAVERSIDAGDYEGAAKQIMTALGKSAPSGKEVIENISNTIRVGQAMSGVLSSVQRGDIRSAVSHGQQVVGNSSEAAPLLDLGEKAALVQDIRTSIRNEDYPEALSQVNELMGTSWSPEQFEQNLNDSQKTIEKVEDAVDDGDWKKAATLAMDGISKYIGISDEVRGDVDHLANIIAAFEEKFGG